jgi:catechol 2,3-dioxygenase-like lactoylglutathione lyase family enzyme
MGVMASTRSFRMGRLDHVHIRVPDRAEAAAWYAKHLGFEAVKQYDFWATGLEQGPLQISADGGETMLTLFQTSEAHPMVAQTNGVAFSVDAETFISFTRSLPGEINGPSGQPLVPDDMIDFDMCWAFNLADPWGNQYELNCYDYGRIKADLIRPDAITAVRYWPRELYDEYSRTR